jgi:hypothetical protein
MSRAVVLVEGNSDRVALHTLAGRHGRDLAAEGVEIVAMDGITNTRTFASRYGPRGLDVPLAGLYDAGEETKLRHGLAAAGLEAAREPDGLAHLGFYACSVDLEDELIRALGVARVQEVVEEHGDLGPFQTLQKQVEWRGRPEAEQLRRFMGSGGRRKQRYARFLVEALEPGQVPRPLARLLEHVTSRA